jgi:membrane protein
MGSFSKFDWNNFFKRLYDRTFDADIFSYSAQIAFYFSFALFPLLYFLISLLGIILVSVDGIRRELFVYLYQIMPREVFYLVRTTIDEIVDKSSGGKATLGLLITLWSASAGFDAVRNALNGVYGLKETRAWWRTKLQSLALTFVVTTIAAFLLGVVFYGWKLVGLALAGIGLEVSSPWVLMTIQWITALALIFFVCQLIYNLLPNHRKLHKVRVTPGSIVAITLWILLSTIFRVYLAYYNSYNKAYGSLGAVIIMMLWLYLTASALMIGGVINSVLREMRLDGAKVAEQDDETTK